MAGCVIGSYFNYRLSPIHVAEPQHVSVATNKVSFWAAVFSVGTLVMLSLHTGHMYGARYH